MNRTYELVSFVAMGTDGHAYHKQAAFLERLSLASLVWNYNRIPLQYGAAQVCRPFPIHASHMVNGPDSARTRHSTSRQQTFSVAERHSKCLPEAFRISPSSYILFHDGGANQVLAGRQLLLGRRAPSVGRRQGDRRENGFTFALVEYML